MSYIRQWSGKSVIVVVIGKDSNRINLEISKIQLNKKERKSSSSYQ